jgi:hypothetical protein
LLQQQMQLLRRVQLLRVQRSLSWPNPLVAGMQCLQAVIPCASVRIVAALSSVRCRVKLLVLLSILRS